MHCTSDPKLVNLAVLIFFYGLLLRDSTLGHTTRRSATQSQSPCIWQVSGFVRPSVRSPRQVIRGRSSARQDSFGRGAVISRLSQGSPLGLRSTSHMSRPRQSLRPSRMHTGPHQLTSHLLNSSQTAHESGRSRTPTECAFHVLGRSPVDFPTAEYKDRDV